MTASQIGTLLLHLREHLVLVLSSAGLASCISLPLGVAIARRRSVTLILASFGILYTLPSLALFGLLVPILGLGAPTAICVLTVYATVFLTRTVTLALRALPSPVVESAHALGTTGVQRLIRIELPLASPALVAGLRTTMIMLIATASIAAWIDGGGLGVLLFEGLRQDDMHRVVTGSVAAAALAIATDSGLAAVERLLRRRLHAN